MNIDYRKYILENAHHVRNEIITKKRSELKYNTSLNMLQFIALSDEIRDLEAMGRRH